MTIKYGKRLIQLSLLQVWDKRGDKSCLCVFITSFHWTTFLIFYWKFYCLWYTFVFQEEQRVWRWSKALLWIKHGLWNGGLQTMFKMILFSWVLDSPILQIPGRYFLSLPLPWMMCSMCTLCSTECEGWRSKTFVCSPPPPTTRVGLHGLFLAWSRRSELPVHLPAYTAALEGWARVSRITR